jgi:asparaginyl-tRNA synthetase
VQEHDFTYTHVPIITSNDCEGAGEAFRIAPVSTSSDPSAPPAEFFGMPAYLTVSTQLHLEALAASVSRVYALSPCFRAEPSQTGRHLAEFWMLEAECTFVDSIEDICSLVEGAVKQVLRSVPPEATHFREAGDDKRRQALIEAARDDVAWARMTYSDAIAHLEQHHARQPDAFQYVPAWGKPLQSEHERWLAEVLVQGPVFVTDYPAALKPFYMRANGDGAGAQATVACFDLLVPGVGELAGGSLREERLARLERAVGHHGLDPAVYGWYTDLRKYGTAPHGGFGMGFERLISWISGVDNVRECIPMPRWAGRMLL